MCTRMGAKNSPPAPATHNTQPGYLVRNSCKLCRIYVYNADLASNCHFVNLKKNLLKLLRRKK